MKAIDDNEIDRIFAETVSDVYSHLLEDQQPLGRDFQKVLHDNLWDLYEASDAEATT